MTNDENIKKEAPDTEENEAAELDLQAQLDEANKEHLYLRAEFDNFRKQSLKERSELLKFGGEAIARDLLEVADVFEKALAMEVTPENLQSFLDGVKLTKKELKSVFNKHGIQEIDCKEKPFDPSTSEALSQIPTTDLKDGLVYDVMRKGYLYHDRVLRYAQVVVATNPEDPS